eukprot:scaffold39117_cov148-Skeletonema_marinoi.AAC.6
MSRQDGTTEEEADALALHFAAAQQQAAQQAAAPFGMMPHGMPGMPPMMGMMPPNFFAMNQGMSMNPSVAAMMAQSQRQHQAQQQAAAFSHAAAFGGLQPHNNMMVPPTLAQNLANSKQPPPGVKPRLVHDAASAPRPVEAPPPKRGPGRPVGSGRNRMKQHLESMKESLIIQGGEPSGGKDPQTGYPYFSDSPTVASQDSSDMSVSNNMNHPGSSSVTALPAVTAQVIFGSGRPEMPPPKWYASSMPLGTADDKFYLSELQCLLREDFVEVFGTTEMEIDLPHQGRNKPIALGQVGLRCKYCNDLPACVRANHAIIYPTYMSGIYNAVQQMYRMHFTRCESVPAEVKSKVETLETFHMSNRGGRKQYWTDSAKRMGMCDTQFGIHFERDPSLPLPPYVATSNHDEEDKEESRPVKEEPEYYPLVLPEDKDLITDYLYLAMEQMQPCNLMDADRVGCYKGRKTGFPGLACRHCVGQAGCGRYFPASEASLSQTTTSQTIVNHVRNCRRCPIDIREQLEFMKMSKAVIKKSDKPKHGGRKVFFRRLWCRIQRIPIIEEEEFPEEPSKKEMKIPRKRKNSDTSTSEAKKSKIDAPESTELNDSSKGALARTEGTKKKKNGRKYAFIGKALLAKGDDTHWLSQAEVYIRQELVEVFTATKEDKYDFGEPEVGQVGVRCVHCAKNRPKDQRVKGHVYYPSSVNAIQQCVKDLQSRHLAICGAIPDNCRERLRSLKGYGSKPEGDSVQYWIDSAKELGLQDSPDVVGVTFYRNPAEKSPADCLAIEKSEGIPSGSFIMRAEDRTSVTDSMALLLKQFRPCRFQASDRRGSRSRDRALGSPGIFCVHCSKKRYFPVTEKKLIDTLILMKTHMNTCTSVPEDIKSSLGYLQHRSLLQKIELGAQWKSKIFKKVWNRLHHEDWSNFDYSSTAGLAKAMSIREEPSQAEDSAIITQRESVEETDQTSNYADNHSSSFTPVEDDDDDEEEASEALRGMQDMIKAAAVWLSERDAEQEKKQARSKGLGQAKNRPGFRGGRGGGRGGRIRSAFTSAS